MRQTADERLQFGPYVLAKDVDLLYRGEEVVPLELRATRVLRHLLENADRVVSKVELLESVWPDVFTSEGVLKKAVSQIRKALSDEASAPRFVETYHGRGYRFIAQVCCPPPVARQHAGEADDRELAAIRAELRFLRREIERLTIALSHAMPREVSRPSLLHEARDA